MNYDAPYVLLIDDDLDISEAIHSILHEEGFEVGIAHNGLEGLEFLRKAPKMPSLILLDIMMPKMNGYEFRTEQLKNPDFSHVPTVVFSAAGRFDEEESYKFTETIKKPLDLDRLLSLVRQYLA